MHILLHCLDDPQRVANVKLYPLRQTPKIINLTSFQVDHPNSVGYTGVKAGVSYWLSKRLLQLEAWICCTNVLLMINHNHYLTLTFGLQFSEFIKSWYWSSWVIFARCLPSIGFSVNFNLISLHCLHSFFAETEDWKSSFASACCLFGIGNRNICYLLLNFTTTSFHFVLTSWVATQ